jgi:hypothetical protein
VITGSTLIMSSGSIGTISTGDVNNYRDTNEENFEKLSQMYGVIGAKDNLKPWNENPQFLSLGGALMMVMNPNGVILTDKGDPVLWVSTDGGHLSVSADIRDENGDLIAQVRGNEWQLNKDLIFDRNFSDNALEVKEKKGSVVLQVAEIGQILYVAGVFRCKSGWTTTIANPWTVTPKLVQNLEVGGSIWQVTAPHVPLQATINTIFDYPSELNFGSCPGYENLKKCEPPIDSRPTAPGVGQIYIFSHALDIGH